ncbi:MAG: hypothetical protein WBC38_02025 [Microgenomates group bacterium]
MKTTQLAYPLASFGGVLGIRYVTTETRLRSFLLLHWGRQDRNDADMAHVLLGPKYHIQTAE